eukprot:scaffold8836_cov62-Phaeocystis_antarctica.AAC.3
MESGIAWYVGVGMNGRVEREVTCLAQRRGGGAPRCRPTRTTQIATWRARSRRRRTAPCAARHSGALLSVRSDCPPSRRGRCHPLQAEGQALVFRAFRPAPGRHPGPLQLSWSKGNTSRA